MLWKFVTILHIDLCMKKVILCIFDEFCFDFCWNTQWNLKNFKKRVFSIDLQRKAKQRRSLCFTINWTMSKYFSRFFSRIKGWKMSFWGEFSRISRTKRSLAVCATVVQLGILRLSFLSIKSKPYMALRAFYPLLFPLFNNWNQL